MRSPLGRAGRGPASPRRGYPTSTLAVPCAWMAPTPWPTACGNAPPPATRGRAASRGVSLMKSGGRRATPPVRAGLLGPSGHAGPLGCPPRRRMTLPATRSGGRGSGALRHTVCWRKLPGGRASCTPTAPPLALEGPWHMRAGALSASRTACPRSEFSDPCLAPYHRLRRTPSSRPSLWQRS